MRTHIELGEILIKSLDIVQRLFKTDVLFNITLSKDEVSHRRDMPLSFYISRNNKGTGEEKEEVLEAAQTIYFRQPSACVAKFRADGIIVA